MFFKFTFFVCFLTVVFANAQNPQIVIPSANSNIIIRKVVLSNDDKYVATCFQDDLILINEANSGKEIYRIKGNYIAFSPNNKYFVIATYNGEYQLFDFKTGLPLFEPWNSGDGPPYTLEFSPNSKQILSVSRKKIIVNTIGESKITRKIVKEKRNLCGNLNLQACVFDASSSKIIIPHKNILCFYNANNLKLEKKLNLGNDYTKIRSVLKLDSALYVVGEDLIEDGLDGTPATVFKKFKLDQENNIISSKTILVGADWENMVNYTSYYLWKIKLKNDKIALFKDFKYFNGSQTWSASEVSIYSLKQDSYLFNLQPERAKFNYETIEDISNDLTFAVISDNYSAYSKRIVQDTVYNGYTNNLEDMDEKSEIYEIRLNFLKNSKIFYVEKIRDARNILIQNSLVNVSTKSNSALSFDFESSPKTISLQHTDTLEKKYFHDPAPYLYSEKGDSSFIFNENGFLKYKIKGKIICHDFSNNKSVFYSSENEIQIYDIPSNSIIKKIKSPQSIDLTRNYDIDASISYANKLLAVSFTFWLTPEDKIRTIYIYNIDSGKLVKELKFDQDGQTVFVNIRFDNSGKKLCLSNFLKGYELRDIEQDKTICKSEEEKCVFLNDNRAFYTQGFDSRDKYLFTYGNSDTCLGFFDRETLSNSLSFRPSQLSFGGINYSTSDSLKTILLSNIDNNIYKIKNNISNYNMESALSNLEKINLPAFIKSANYIKNSQYILAEDVHDRYHIIDDNTNKTLYTFLFLPNHNWLVYDEHYRFDGSPGAIEKLYFVCGLEVVELNQVKDSLYVPNLVQRIMNGENLNHLPKLSNLQICGVTPLVEPLDEKNYKYRITPRTGGIGDIDIYINGVVRQTINTKKLKKDGNAYVLNIDPSLIKNYSTPGEENQIKVIAKTANNSISSRGKIMQVESTDNIKLKQPSVHAVMIGIDDYKGDEIDLNYAAKDANDFQMALQLATKKYFNTDDTNRVNFYNLTIDRNAKIGTDKIKGTTPDKGAILNTLQQIEKNSKPEDVFILFFAGHGEIVDKDQLLLLTTEAGKDNFQGIRMRELLEQVNKIPAGKRILILDACHSGAAINNLDMAQYTGKRDVKDAELKSQRLKELDKLASKSGFVIITASSSDQKALELPQYEHGLLTYALLNAMLNNKNALNENNQLQLNKWLDATEEEMEKLSKDQSAESMVPISFIMGKIDDEVRNSIQLKELPTVFIENVMNLNIGFDNLGIKKLLADGFAENSRGAENKLFIADTPGAIHINIIYETTGLDITAKIVLMKNQNLIDKITLTGNNKQLSDFINQLMQKVKSAIQK